MCTWIAVKYSAPVAAAIAVFLIYPIGKGSFFDGMHLGIYVTFNFMIVFQAEHMLGVFGCSLFSAMPGNLWFDQGNYRKRINPLMKVTDSLKRKNPIIS